MLVSYMLSDNFIRRYQDSNGVRHKRIKHNSLRVDAIPISLCVDLNHELLPMRQCNQILRKYVIQ